MADSWKLIHPDGSESLTNFNPLQDLRKRVEKERDQKVVEIVEECKVYRNTFIQKKELIRKLEEAFPEK